MCSGVLLGARTRHAVCSDIPDSEAVKIRLNTCSRHAFCLTALSQERSALDDTPVCDWQIERLWTRMNVIMLIEILMSHPFELIHMSPRVIINRSGSRAIAHCLNRKPVSGVLGHPERRGASNCIVVRLAIRNGS
jgi:hypothetical protein